ncbi:MAG: PIN domain-containing protein [Chitinophagaceae bacterium]
MYIFIDTNIYFNNWYLNNPNFVLFFNYLENSDSRLLISPLVVNEVENIYKREWVKQKDTFNKSLRQLTQLNPQFSAPEISNESDYSFNSVLFRMRSFVTSIGYEKISHETLVKRAIEKIKPFQENEKGYRDSLIWLSFLAYLQNVRERIVGNVAFITNNKSDFGDANTGFLKELKDDIVNHEILHKIVLYNSLQEFIEENIPKEEHLLSYSEIKDKYLYPLESKIESMSAELINSMTPDQLASKASNWHRNTMIHGYIHSQYFEIIEGTEDLEVLRIKEIDKDTIYVNCSLNFRKCALFFTIPSSYYVANKNSLDQNYDEVNYENEETILSIFPRVYLDISITMFKSSGFIYRLEIDNLEFH